MKREFRFSHVSNCTLQNNQNHQFALRHSLLLYKSNAIYTFIPKNACSTMRFSVAYDNGCVQGLQDVNWIHANNNTFSADNKSALQADYTFTILRCPFARVYSAFMDKIVGLTTQGWQYHIARGRKLLPYDVTFDYFVRDIGQTPRGQMDIHWRPQVDFLLYKNYDFLFCVENWNKLTEWCQEYLELEIIDTRDALNHDTKSLVEVEVDSEPYTMKALDLLILKRKGLQPEILNFFTDENISILNKVYKNDIDEYVSLFGKSQMMTVLGI